MAGDTILVRLRAIGANRFRSEMDSAGASTANLGTQGRAASGGLDMLGSSAVVTTGYVKALGTVCGITAGSLAIGALIQGVVAASIVLGALAVAAAGAGLAVAGFAAGAVAWFKQMKDIGGSAANELAAEFTNFKSIVAKELGPAFDPVFRAMTKALTPLAGLVRQLAPAFAVLGKAVAEAVTQATAILVSMGPQLDQFLRQVAQLIPAIVPLLGELFRIFLAIANAAMPYLISGLQALTGWLQGLSSGGVTAAVHESFEILGTLFGAVAFAVRLLTPVFLSLVDGIKQIAQGALPGLISGIQSLIPAFQAIVDSGVLKTLAQAIAGVFAVGAAAISAVVVWLQKRGLLKPVILAIVGALVAWKVAMVGAMIVTKLSAALHLFRGLLFAVRSGTLGLMLAQYGLNTALLANPVGIVIALLVALGAGLVLLWKKSETFRNIVTGVWNAVKTAAGTAVGWIRSKIDGLVSFLAGLPARVSSAVSGMWNGIKDGFRSALNWIIGKWNGLQFTVPKVDLGPLGSIGGGTIGVPDIPLLAAGGTIASPGMAIVGEQGPELVTLGTGATVHPAGSPATQAAVARPRRGRTPEDRVTHERQPIIVQTVMSDGRVLADAVADIILERRLGMA